MLSGPTLLNGSKLALFAFGLVLDRHLPRLVVMFIATRLSSISLATSLLPSSPAKLRALTIFLLNFPSSDLGNEIIIKLKA
jgi:hypothetical protein